MFIRFNCVLLCGLWCCAWVCVLKPLPSAPEYLNVNRNPSVNCFCRFCLFLFNFSFRCVFSLTESTRAASRANRLDMFCVSTERAMGKGCVARELCPVATAEAHAGTRTFLREKQNQFVQRKYHASPTNAPIPKVDRRGDGLFLPGVRFPAQC